MEAEVLQLLPARGIDRSLLLAVLCGLWILWFFVERFGWVFSGLVVPGYLAAVFIVQPVSGGAIVVEAVLTYLLARGLSDGASRLGGWSRFFGRDRFFLILLLSVVVRQHCELWAFPDVVHWAEARFGVTLGWERSLYGVGLVLVPLLANMFWKLDLKRGLWQVGVPTALTWALLWGVILPLTNYGLSSLELTYEDVAVNFLGSAKIHIILLVTAALAAAVNLYGGWDFGGILVPALVAVAWFTPVKVVTTLVEAVVLLGVVTLLLRHRPLSKLNLEGPRKVVLVFTVGFALKAAIAALIGDRFPGMEVTDLFGFGYLLPSLLAIKMLTRRTVGRVLGPTVAVSVAGLVIGSALALVVEWAAPTAVTPRAVAATRSTAAVTWRDAMTVAVVARLRADQAAIPTPHAPADTERVASVWRLIDRWLAEADPRPPPGPVRERAAALGLSLEALEDGAGYVLAEPIGPEAATLPSALLRPGAPGPYLWVPRPASEAPVAEAAVAWCATLRCRAVLFAGVERGGAERRHRPLLAALGASGIVQLHADAETEAGRPVLHVFGAAPSDVTLGMLDALPEWDPPPARLDAGEVDRERAVLRMNPADMWRAVVPEGAVAALDGALDGWLAARLELDALAPGPVAPPTAIERQVWSRLLGRDMLAGPPPGFPAERDWARWLDRLAGLVGHRALRTTDPLTGRRCVLLLGVEGQPGRVVLVVVEGSPDTRGEAVVVEVPRPLRQPGTWRFGLELWRAADARAVMVAIPRRAPNDTVDAAPTGADSAWHAAHVGLFGALVGEGGGVLARVGGYGAWRALDHEAIVALETPLFADAPLPAPVAALLDAAPLAALHGLIAVDRAPAVEGPAPPGLLSRRPQAELIGLVNQPDAQRDHARRRPGARYVRIWLSEAARADYVGRTPEPMHPLLDDALGAPIDGPGRAALLAPALAPPGSSLPTDPAFEAAVADAVAYGESDNPHRLRALAARAEADPGLRLAQGYTPSEGRRWLLVERRAPVEGGMGVQRALIYRDARATAQWVGVAGHPLPRFLRRFRVVRVSGLAEGGAR